MRVNVIQHNRVLFVRTAMKCGRVVGTTLLMEDPDDISSAISLGLYNYVLSTEDPLVIFPPGTYLAVTDPYFRHLRDMPSNLLGMRCDNPQCITVFADRDCWLTAKSRCLGSAGGVERTVSADKALAFCEKGNEMFSKTYYHRALMFYTAALESSEIGNELIIRCLSNRANAHIKLEQWPEAASDARSILTLSPTHVKGQYSLALSLLCCQRPIEAIQILKGLLDQLATAEAGADGSNAYLKAALELQRDISIAILEQEEGRFDRKEMMREASKGGTGMCMPISRKHMDYWSAAIEVRAVAGKGRGVFVKAGRSIPVGALLVASKADVSSLACVSATNNRVNKKSIFSSDGQDMATTSSALLYPLAIRHLVLHPTAGPAFYALSANPSFDMAPLNDEQSTRVDVQRIMAVLRSNAFSAFTNDDGQSVDALLKQIEEGDATASYNDDQKKESGLWVKPSMFNHSCFSNSSYENIGDFLFVFTVKPIGPNEEITIPYCKLSFAGVTKTFRNWKGVGEGFVCMCERCTGVRNNATLCSVEQEVGDAHVEISRQCAALRQLASVVVARVMPLKRHELLITEMETLVSAGVTAAYPTLIQLLEMRLPCESFCQSIQANQSHLTFD